MVIMVSEGYVGIKSVCVEGILERIEMDIEKKEPCVYVCVCACGNRRQIEVQYPY